MVAFQSIGFTLTLLLANALTVFFGVTFYQILPPPPTPLVGGVLSSDSLKESESIKDSEDGLSDSEVLLDNRASSSSPSPPPSHVPMKLRDRCAFTRELSKYMVPLLVVYFAEYAMQSGTWAAIGFPVTDEEARKEFYTWANWTYQAGVFASRSSGKIYRPSLTAVQAMPALQVLLLAFFYAVAYFKILYGYGLMAPCFMTGLLGGCVYVNAFSLISEEVEGRERKELALATASVADSFGIMMADVAGLFIQACLYEKHGIEGAKVQCIY